MTSRVPVRAENYKKVPECCHWVLWGGRGRWGDKSFADWRRRGEINTAFHFTSVAYIMVLLISTYTMASGQRRRELNTSLLVLAILWPFSHACIQTQKSLSSPSSSLLPGILKKIVHPSEMSILSEVHHQPSHLLLWDYHHFQGDGAIVLFFIMRITKVFVPRTLVFGLEEAKASPWNVACFRSIQDVFSHCNLWKQTETQFMQIIINMVSLHWLWF